MSQGNLKKVQTFLRHASSLDLPFELHVNPVYTRLTPPLPHHQSTLRLTHQVKSDKALVSANKASSQSILLATVPNFTCFVVNYSDRDAHTCCWKRTEVTSHIGDVDAFGVFFGIWEQLEKRNFCTERQYTFHIPLCIDLWKVAKPNQRVCDFLTCWISFRKGFRRGGPQHRRPTPHLTLKTFSP